MKIFKRKTKVTKLSDGRIMYEHPKKSKGRVFLEGLRKAVYLNKSKEQYEKKFFDILVRVEDKEIIRKAMKKHFTLLENLEKAEKSRKGKIEGVTQINVDKLQEAIKLSVKNPDVYVDGKYYSQLLKDSQLLKENVKEPKKLSKPSKFKMWFKSVVLNIKESWELVKELGREVQYWLIAEYKIFTKLSYALSRKKNEIKVRKAFDSNKKFFTEKFGYDKGMNYFNTFSSKLNRGVELNKRMLDKGM